MSVCSLQAPRAKLILLLLILGVCALWHFSLVPVFDSVSGKWIAQPHPGDSLEPRRLVDTKGLLMVHGGHLTNDDCNAEDICIKSDKLYMIALYLFGIIYMFFAVCIVCDEFFVPALEVFVEKFNVSMDVAGATLMAAGGSMPELSASFIGTFTESDVGFSTIVGSAVFNVLFVIGVCAVFSEKAIVLTWWPLFRDMVCYIVGLITLAFFLTVTTPSQIHLWEAVVLFFLYVSYCVFMRYNTQFLDCVLELMGRKDLKQVTPGEEKYGEGGETPTAEGETKADTKKSTGSVSPTLAKSSHFAMPSTIRSGILQFLTQKKSVVETAGVMAASKMKGDISDIFDEIDKDKSGLIETTELKVLLEKLGCETDDDNVIKAARQIGHKTDGKIGLQAFSKWYMSSQMRLQAMVSEVFDEFDKDKSQSIDKSEVKDMLEKLGHSAERDAVDAAMRDMLRKRDEEDRKRPSVLSSFGFGDYDGDNSTPRLEPVPDDVKIDFEQFARWYADSMFGQDKLDKMAKDAEEDEGIFNIDFPDWDNSASSYFHIAMYWYTYPVCAVLYATMPDVRAPHSSGFELPTAILQFLLSLVWIVIFSFCLVDWVTLCSNTIGIPVVVAAVTVLAAGTSIPDLLSSYIVAKKGEGDMAVSSSIGSNIFDICFGLPVPWICWCAQGKYVTVKSDTIPQSVCVLFVMLIAVVLVIKFSNWRMTKAMGYAMFGLYILFLVYYFVAELVLNK